MVDILLSTEDITVLGPPEFIDVSVDIGPTGTRGSQIFIGSGDPNDPATVISSETPIFNDLYINAAPGANYGFLYQYINDPAGDVWESKLKINPVIYSSIVTTTFTNGSASIVIPVTNIVTSTTLQLTADKFAVQYSIAGDNPIASSMAIPSLSSGNLTINLKAVESDSGTWGNLSGSYSVHLFISLVMV